MRRNWINLAGLAVSLLLLFNVTAEAKWWIFGKSEEAVTIDYLYINQLAFEEKDQKVVLFKQFLNNGMVVIRGKASVAKGSIGAVSVSLDDRKTWQEAKLGTGGSFEFQFRPEIGRTYDLYVRVMDTLGKTNDVEATHKQVSLSDSNLNALIKEVLDQMVRAYMAEDPAAFMRHVSEEFAGDELVLDSAVRRDFTFFDNLQLGVTISNIAAGAEGRIHVAISYTRSVVSSRSGRPLRDKGLTEFIFVQKGEGAKVYAMKYPLIFGLSDAANVATGTVVSALNNETLVVDDTGQAEVVPLQEALRRLEEGPGASGIPTPTNLAVHWFDLHHNLILQFESTLNYASAQGVYETVVEESRSPGGPWLEVARTSFDTMVDFTSSDIASYGGLLYYRVRIERISSGAQSAPSNVLEVDNS